MDEPPNFNGTYPLAGAQIGPAWRAAWILLSDGKWHGKIEILDTMRSAGPIALATAGNLLRQARRVGVLEVRRNQDPSGRDRAADYRITPRDES